MKTVSIFEKGPSFVADQIVEAAEWVCGDWPQDEGFGSSDRKAVYHDALRSIIGAENVSNWMKGNLEFNPVEWQMFKDFADLQINEQLIRSEQRYA